MAAQRIDNLNINNYLTISCKQPDVGQMTVTGQFAYDCYLYKSVSGGAVYISDSDGCDSAANGIIIGRRTGYAEITPTTYFLLAPSTTADRSYVSPVVKKIGNVRISRQIRAQITYTVYCVAYGDNDEYIGSLLYSKIPETDLYIQDAQWDDNILIGGTPYVGLTVTACYFRNQSQTALMGVFTKDQLISFYDYYPNFQAQLAGCTYGGFAVLQPGTSQEAGSYGLITGKRYWQTGDIEWVPQRLSSTTGIGLNANHFIIPFLSETEYHAARAATSVWSALTKSKINNWTRSE